MKNLFKKSFLSLSLLAICLLMGASINKVQAQASGTNTGIWDTYVLIGSATNTFFVDGSHLNDPSTIGFNGLDLGIYPVGGTLKLAGGLDFVAKVTNHANICSGKLYYSVYPTGGSPTSWDSIGLNWTSTYGNVIVDSVTNQEWSASVDSNILTGLAAGSYSIQVYFTSTGSDTTINGANNCATLYTENNSGHNYTATFIVASTLETLDEAGIFDSYVLIGASPNSSKYTTYFAGGPLALVYPTAPLFAGANLGTLTTADTLNLAGGDDYTYKVNDTGNVCGGVLYYAVYDSGGSPGEFSTLALGYSNAYGDKGKREFGDSLITQEWHDSTNVTNVIALTGLNPGTYYLQVYFSSTGSTVIPSGPGDCSQTFVEFNSGANYTAKFKLTYPAGINNISDNNTWLTYPNPVTTQLNISAGTSVTKADKIELFDVLGRPVYTATEVTGNPLEIDMTHINIGTYFVRITTQQGAFVRTVVKE